SARASQFRLLADDDLGADRNPLVEIHDVAVDQPEAPGRNGAADGLRLIGAMDAIDRGAEIERPRPHGIAGAAGHEARQIGLALDLFRPRGPARPLLLPRDLHQALPLETVAADADAVAQRAPARLHDIEKALGGVHDDGARRLGGAEQDELAPIA